MGYLEGHAARSTKEVIRRTQLECGISGNALWGHVSVPGWAVKAEIR